MCVKPDCYDRVSVLTFVELAHKQVPSVRTGFDICPYNFYAARDKSTCAFLSFFLVFFFRFELMKGKTFVVVLLFWGWLALIHTM